jgi:alpha-galactosidase
MHRLTRILGLTLLLASAAAAEPDAVLPAGFAGAWRLDLPKPWGVTLHTTLILRQDGPRIVGTVSPNNAYPQPFQHARIQGAELLFDFAWGWTFRVTAAPPNLHVVVGYGEGKRDEGTAYPASAADLATPAPLPLPAVRDLPDNGLARTPPMGWNSWNHFSEQVDDAVVRRAADAMVSSGMAAAGYVYINIDDTWEAGRDGGGNMVPNRKFPDMKGLADYVHARGLKLGLYSSPGPLTCGGYAGSFGFEAQDARTYAAWGIDYLKYDWCSAGRIYPSADVRPVYQKMGAALQACGRPIVFSLCEYGMEAVWTWGHGAGGNLWRTTGDIQDNWESMAKIGFNQGRLAPYAGPGHWNDPDMLEVGNGGMNPDEYRTHFSLWCMLAAPLMAGNDLSTMSDTTRDLLTNREVIAIDQDVLGREATRVSARNGVEVWSKPLFGHREAVALFNRGDRPARAAYAWPDLGRPATPTAVRDAWNHADLAPADNGFSGVIPAHGVVVLILR